MCTVLYCTTYNNIVRILLWLFSGLDGTMSYYRGCFFNNQLGLADWSVVLWCLLDLTKYVTKHRSEPLLPNSFHLKVFCFKQLEMVKKPSIFQLQGSNPDPNLDEMFGRRAWIRISWKIIYFVFIMFRIS